MKLKYNVMHFICFPQENFVQNYEDPKNIERKFINNMCERNFNFI